MRTCERTDLFGFCISPLRSPLREASNVDALSTDRATVSYRRSDLALPMAQAPGNPIGQRRAADGVAFLSGEEVKGKRRLETEPRITISRGRIFPELRKLSRAAGWFLGLDVCREGEAVKGKGRAARGRNSDHGRRRREFATALQDRSSWILDQGRSSPHGVGMSRRMTGPEEL